MLRHSRCLVLQLMGLPHERANANAAVRNRVCKGRKRAAAHLFGARSARSRENFEETKHI